MEDETLQQWGKEFGFLSMRSISSDKQLEQKGIVDNVLATLLNPNGIIQIGCNVFKLNIPDEIIMCMDSTDFVDESSFLNKSIFKSYSIYDNVLDIIQGLDVINETNFENRTNKVTKSWDVYGGKVDCKLVYQKAGIYFSLQSKIKKSFSGGSTYIALSVQSGSWLQPKRRKKKSIPTYSNGGYDRVYHYRPYQSWRSLKHYDFNVLFYVNGYNTGTYSTVLRLKK